MAHPFDGLVDKEPVARLDALLRGGFHVQNVVIGKDGLGFQGADDPVIGLLGVDEAGIHHGVFVDDRDPHLLRQDQFSCRWRLFGFGLLVRRFCRTFRQPRNLAFSWLFLFRRLFCRPLHGSFDLAQVRYHELVSRVDQVRVCDVGVDFPDQGPQEGVLQK